MEKKETVRGQVKWFDTTKGFGFIVAEGCKSDILLHANVLRSYGRSSIAGNAGIEVYVQRTERGCQATEILGIDSPEAKSGFAVIEQMLGEGVVVNPRSKLQPARVKWFDRGKGFGFVNAFGDQNDIFVHMEVLHHCGIAELQPGEAVAVRTADGPRGLMAWDVRVWDHVLDEKDG